MGKAVEFIAACDASLLSKVEVHAGKLNKMWYIKSVDKLEPNPIADSIAPKIHLVAIHACAAIAKGGRVHATEGRTRRIVE